jgi:replication-associated recombination protein RarA
MAQFACFDPTEAIRNMSIGEISQPNTIATPAVEIQRLTIHVHIIHRLDQFIAKNQIPHIIFHGPSGSGKLTLVREFIARIYDGHKSKTKTHVMTVNCSHGKGIQFIREELKFFAKANAQTKTAGDFKIILLLNAHHLTVDAQSALRRCIELFSYNTRFFIVVENKNKLLNPILSRFCDVFVPEPVIGNKSVNLHQYVLSQQFVQEEDIALETLDSALGTLSRIPTKDMMEIVNRLYESGISCLDLMRWIESRRDRWTELEHSRAVMRFYQIKPQFRCEKLLMLFMVNFLFGEG